MRNKFRKNIYRVVLSSVYTHGAPGTRYYIILSSLTRITMCRDDMGIVITTNAHYYRPTYLRCDDKITIKYILNSEFDADMITYFYCQCMLCGCGTVRFRNQVLGFLEQHQDSLGKRFALGPISMVTSPFDLKLMWRVVLGTIDFRIKVLLR